MSLADELQMRRPFATLQDEALVSIFATWNLLCQHLQKELGRHGLTLAQYNVLRILRGAGSDGLPVMMIADRMVARYPNVTRLTDRLEKVAWIRRERSSSDRRVVRAFVTQGGLDLLTAVDKEMEHCVQHLMRGTSVEDHHTLIRILEEVRLPLRPASPSGPSLGPGDNGRPSENGKKRTR
jgi:DNA-binding MarR family transcriptional regulator